LPESPRVGTRLRFALRDADLAREDLRAALAHVTPANAAIHLGASDRGRALFGHAGLECALVSQALAPAPVVGHFGSFEIAPVGGRPAQLWHAGVVVALDGGDR
jgi:small ligand-binding sensory domain FIST